MMVAGGSWSAAFSVIGGSSFASALADLEEGTLLFFDGGEFPPSRGTFMTLEQAIELAARAHSGQFYETAEGPEPYILHPLRVMMKVSPRARVVAILHDVLEDTKVMPIGMDPIDWSALNIITRVIPERYPTYITRVKEAEGEAGEIAREVKIADLRENLGHVRPGHRMGFKRRYEEALSTLGESF